MKLAKAREREHPQDAIAIYQGRIDPIANLKHNQAYDDAAKLVGAIKALMDRTAEAKEFSDWLGHGGRAAAVRGYARQGGVHIRFRKVCPATSRTGSP